MSRLLIILFALLTQGCAYNNGVLTPTLLADMYNKQDPCQLSNYPGGVNNPDNVKLLPSFCGKSTAPTEVIIVDRLGRQQDQIVIIDDNNRYIQSQDRKD